MAPQSAPAPGTALQWQKTVAAYFSSKQLLPFDFASLYSQPLEESETRRPLESSNNSRRPLDQHTGKSLFIVLSFLQVRLRSSLSQQIRYFTVIILLYFVSIVLQKVTKVENHNILSKTMLTKLRTKSGSWAYYFPLLLLYLIAGKDHIRDHALWWSLAWSGRIHWAGE